MTKEDLREYIDNFTRKSSNDPIGGAKEAISNKLIQFKDSSEVSYEAGFYTKTTEFNNTLSIEYLCFRNKIFENCEFSIDGDNINTRYGGDKHYKKTIIFKNCAFNDCQFKDCKNLYEVKFYNCVMLNVGSKNCNIELLEFDVRITSIGCFYDVDFTGISISNLIVHNSKPSFFGRADIYYYNCLFTPVTDDEGNLITRIKINRSNIVPERGKKLYGYKVAAIIPKNKENYKPHLIYDFALVKLLIPEDAERVCGLSSLELHKCRCNYCKVLSIKPISFMINNDLMSEYKQPDYIGRILDDEVDCRKYRVEPCFAGKTNGIKYVRHYTILDFDNYDDDKYAECGGGINFFLTKKEAIMFLLGYLHQYKPIFLFDE